MQNNMFTLNRSFGVFRSFFLLMSLLCVCSCASSRNQRAVSSQPVLQFGADSTFKLLQLTDCHIAADNPAYAEYSEHTFDRISRLVREENPDLIVFTGDIVLKGDMDHLYRRLLDSLNTFGIPFCYCYGNHDTEFDFSAKDIAPYISASPYSLAQVNAKGEIADYRVNILGHEGIPAFCVYCMDSHSYSTDPRIKGYAWFTPDQVEWFRKDAAGVTAANGGKPVPSFMFYHIPVREYNYDSCPQQDRLAGHKGESECIQKLNTGMFAAALEHGGVLGMSVGHDHDNDYVYKKYGIALCYGRFSGDKTIYHHVVPGARVFLFKENSTSFETWIREQDGTVLERITVFN